MTDIIILFCTTTLGLFVGQGWENKLLRKEKLYQELYDFAVRFRANVNSSKRIFSSFLDEYCTTAGRDFAACCSVVLSEKSNIFRLVKGNEFHYIQRFFAGLDAENCKELCDHLDYFCDYFFAVLQQIQADNKQKNRLGQKLGLLCGVIIGLVLI